MIIGVTILARSIGVAVPSIVIPSGIPMVVGGSSVWWEVTAPESTGSIFQWDSAPPIWALITAPISIAPIISTSVSVSVVSEPGIPTLTGAPWQAMGLTIGFASGNRFWLGALATTPSAAWDSTVAGVVGWVTVPGGIFLIDPGME